MADSPRIEELKRRVQMDPASIAFAALAEEYRRAGRFEESVATCLAGLQRHPAYLSAHVTLGRAYLELGEHDKARNELERVLRAAPENLAAIRGLAEIHHRRGELAEALELYKSALNVARHDMDLQETVATITRQLGKRDEAPEALAAVVPIDVASFELAFPGDTPSAAVSIQNPPVPDGDGALAGLEEFLAAILRARDTDRSADSPSPRR